MENSYIKRMHQRLIWVLRSNHWFTLVWLLLVILTLLSSLLAEGPQSEVEGKHTISVLLVAAIALSKGTLVIDYFMGLKHTQGWPVRIMKFFLILMLGLITISYFYY